MSQFPEQLGSQVWIGEFADDASATAWVKLARLDTNGDGSGDPQDWTQYGNTTTGKPRYYRAGSWRNMGEAVQIDDFLATVDGNLIMTTEGNLVSK